MHRLQRTLITLCLALLLQQPGHKGCCSGELLPISDVSYPYITLVGGSQQQPQQPQPVVWHTRRVAFRLAHSAAVRVNARGVRFVPSTHTLQLSMQYGIDEAGSSINRNGSRNSSSATYLRQRLWWNSSYSTAREEASARQSIQPNRWRSAACIPAR